jgi:predicted aspartyl protease
MNHGDLLVQARVNGSQPLAFKLDTGFGITTINPDRVESLNLTRQGHMTIIGIAGEEQADTFKGAAFDFGGIVYEPRRVASLPSESRRRWRNRDGILGAGFFRRFVVELDLQNSRMRLHEPQSFTYSGTGEVLPLEFKKDTPIVEAVIAPREGEKVSARLEIDTGCDGCLCLGNEFVNANRLVETNSAKSEFRRGVGGDAPIHQAVMTELRLGKLVVKKPSANCFTEGSPAGPGLAGHIGLDALQRFKMIFDYSRRQLILEPLSPDR